tara:strand:- start:64 stop:411 length:348 start_codon:yes stop_codon:yes gene_type:complete
MPLYEYQCERCSHRFEQIQRFSDPPVACCPECDGAVRKLVSSPAIQFKGTGWYVTDYARKEAQGANASSEGDQTTDSAGTNSDGKTTKTSDAKVASGSKKTSTAASTGTAKTSKT